MNSEDRRRHYLQALEISLWLPRRPSAIQAATAGPSPALPEDHATADPAPAPGLERFAETVPAEAAMLVAPASAESWVEDDWMPAMDDDWELLTDSDDPAETAVTAIDHRAAWIADLAWDALAEAVQQCTACHLCTSRTQTVFGVGDRQADWLIVGEAPGADEDHQGEPFVGRAGKLLNPMLQAIGLQREQVFIANILKCRPPDNRDPAPAEAASCRPFLERQIALIQPRIILAVGRIAAQNLLNTDTQIGKLRGQIHRFGTAQIPLVVTYHPAYLLRSPREKRKTWDDLRLARRALAGTAS